MCVPQIYPSGRTTATGHARSFQDPREQMSRLHMLARVQEIGIDPRPIVRVFISFQFSHGGLHAIFSKCTFRSVGSRVVLHSANRLSLLPLRNSVARTSDFPSSSSFFFCCFFFFELLVARLVGDFSSVKDHSFFLAASCVSGSDGSRWRQIAIDIVLRFNGQL